MLASQPANSKIGELLRVTRLLYGHGRYSTNLAKAGARSLVFEHDV
jgi:hypothetical protein